MDTEEIKKSNPWWLNKAAIDDDFHLTRLEKQKVRWNYEIIEKLEEGIYTVRGPRQVGKTTWIKQTIKKLLRTANPNNILFYSCDTVKEYKELMDILGLFLDISDENSNRYIFLDEIPYVNEWQRAIKHIYDAGRFENCCVILSGSHSIDIKRSTELLPGRGDRGKRHYTMLPLTFPQYLEAVRKSMELTDSFKKNIALLKLNTETLEREYKTYLQTGGFLRVINELISNKTIDDTTYDVYLKWIIGDLAKWEIRENYSKQIVRKVIDSYTTEISWSSIKSGTDIDSHNTVSKYVNAIEEMFVFNFIYSLDFNRKRADFPKSKKIYFVDPFIIASCYRWTTSKDNIYNEYKTFLEKNVSKISEGVILSHLISNIYKRIKANVYDYKDLIFYWKNKNKTKEADFVYRNIAVELKYQENINKEDYKALKDFRKGFLVTKNVFDERTFPLPAFLILMEKHFDEMFG